MLTMNYAELCLAMDVFGVSKPPHESPAWKTPQYLPCETLSKIPSQACLVY